MKHLERLNDEQLLDAAVAEFARVTGLPVAFGGYEISGGTTVTAVSGTRTSSLEGLRVAAGRGLGGRAMAELRPRLTSDYERSQQITHDYDREVLDAGIISLIAIPIVAAGHARAVLYGGARSTAALAGIFRQPVTEITESLARELHLRDEVRRRSALVPPRVTEQIPAQQLEELRASYAELRQAMSAVQEPAVRAQLGIVEQRLARLSGAEPAPPTDDQAEIRLTPRELDVLSQVALGATNARAGQSLGLTEGTIKSYLKSACAKLGVSTRHAAVAAARRAGLIP